MNVGLVFGIIFAIIVMGFLLFFGYSRIIEILELNEDVLIKKQMTDLEKTADRVFEMSMGTTQDFDFKFYKTINNVCFIDPENPDSNQAMGWELDDYLKKLIDDGKYNMIIFINDMPDGNNITHVLPLENFCIDKPGKLWLENKGTYVDIRK